ncbi:Uncharacterized protein Adt_38241 [Abeliophyllum distichum]|uniref:Uncharacterized protein n=1 Tax=Abeliophyllum distichum TaxID=126358 RepID=A0ABD1Q1P3_9LAMI
MSSHFDLALPSPSPSQMHLNVPCFLLPRGRDVIWPESLALVSPENLGRNPVRLAQEDGGIVVEARHLPLDIMLIDGVLKNGAIVIVPLSNDSPNVLQEQTNYRIVYLRQFENEKILYEHIPDDEKTVVALRKTGASNGLMNSSTKDASCGIASEVMKSALKGLEDVYLEPPRQALMVV